MTQAAQEYLGRPIFAGLPLLGTDRLRRFAHVLGSAAPTAVGSSAGGTPEWLPVVRDPDPFMLQYGALYGPGLIETRVGDWVEWNIAHPGRTLDGAIHLWLGMLKGQALGTFSISLDGVVVQANVDPYTPGWAWGQFYFYLGDGSGTVAKVHKLRMTCTGKNAASSNRWAPLLSFLTVYNAITAAT